MTKKSMLGDCGAWGTISDFLARNALEKKCSSYLSHYIHLERERESDQSIQDAHFLTTLLRIIKYSDSIFLSMLEMTVTRYCVSVLTLVISEL